MSALKNIFLMLVSPTEGWKDAGKYNIPHGVLLKSLFFPLLFILLCSNYLPLLYTPNECDAIICTQHGILSVVKYIFGLYISAYFLSTIFSFVRREADYFNRFNNFLIYNLSVLVLLEILSNLFLYQPFFIVFRLYIVYVIYKGLKYLQIPTDAQVKFVSYTGVIVLLIPLLTELLVGLCIPNYK